MPSSTKSFTSNSSWEGRESKNKYVMLTIMEKVDILKKTDKGLTVKSVCAIYGADHYL